MNISLCSNPFSKWFGVPKPPSLTGLFGACRVYKKGPSLRLPYETREPTNLRLGRSFLSFLVSESYIIYLLICLQIHIYIIYISIYLHIHKYNIKYIECKQVKTPLPPSLDRPLSRHPGYYSIRWADAIETLVLPGDGCAKTSCGRFFLGFLRGEGVQGEGVTGEP